MDQGQAGWIVSWKVPKEVPLTVVWQALAKAGLSTDMAKVLDNENALKRAFREMTKERVIRKLRSEGQNIYFQFTREYLGSKEAVYTKEAELCLDRKTGNVTSDVPELAAEASALLQAHSVKRLTSDLTRIVQRIFDAAKADLVPIREEGFAYFVPQQHAALVYKASAFLELIGGQISQFAIRMGSGPTDKSIADSMAAHMLALIKEFRESCRELNEESRIDMKHRRMQTVIDLKDKLNSYQGMLVGFTDRINAELSVAEQEMLQALKTSAAVPA